MTARRRLTVAVTGPTGTFGFGLVPLLEADDRIGEIVGIARRPFDPAEHGWSKLTYRQGDVRDQSGLERAFEGADVVVHLAFSITGTAARATAREINVEGTLHAFRAAAAVGARRFVYASSVAAYGFHADNPLGITEDWPTRPADHLFYAQEKAELEHLLQAEAQAHARPALYLLRPPIVLGPHALGAKDIVPDRLKPLVRVASSILDKMPVRIPVTLPAIPMQFVHEDDVGQAFVLCIVGAGPPGTYNLAAEGTVTAHDVARELGLLPLPFPLAITQQAARALASTPLPSFVPPATEWAEALSHPVLIDSAKARGVLGWTPRFSGLEAVRATVHPDPPP